jgi:allophanate hydrolase subunit 1
MPTMPQPRFLTSGDTAVVVEFGVGIDRHISALVLALAQRIDEAGIDGIVETVPTFRSLMIHYDPLRLPQVRLKARLADLLQDLRPSEAVGRLWRIPACLHVGLPPGLSVHG